MVCSDTLCWINLVISAFLLITFPIYIFVLYILVKKRSALGSSFFILCISCGIADLGWGFQQLFLRRLPVLLVGISEKAKSFVLSNAFASFSLATAWALYYPQIFGVFILSVNRLTAICFPIKYKTWWNKSQLKVVLILQWLTLFPLSLPFIHPYFHAEMDNNTMQPWFANADAFNIMWSIDIVIEAGILLPAIIIIHIVIFVKSIQYKPSSEEQKKEMSLEIRFAIIGSVLCSLYAWIAINFLKVWYDGRWTNPSLHKSTIIAQALYLTANPYLLLCFSTKVRGYAVETLTCGTKAFVVKVVPAKPTGSSARNKNPNRSSAQ